MFLYNGNWHAGLWAVFHSWITIPKYCVRLAGGTKIILIGRVFMTAITIVHILIFFIIAFTSVFMLIFDELPRFATAVHAIPQTLSLITGEFNTGIWSS